MFDGRRLRISILSRWQTIAARWVRRSRYESELQRIRDIAKVDLVGVQDEKIYLDVSTPAGALCGLVQDQASPRATGSRSAAPADAGRGLT